MTNQDEQGCGCGVRVEKVEADLSKLRKSIEVMSRKLRIEMLKQCVMSEVCRLSPSSFPHIVRAFDMPDEWWTEGEDLAVAEWPNRLLPERLNEWYKRLIELQ